MKDWSAILVCLLLSCCVWMVMNLSRNNRGTLDVTVIAQSNLPGRALSSVEPVLISARCRTVGFTLLENRLFGGGVKKVFIKSEDLTYAGGDFYTFPASLVNKYTEQIFGQGVTVEMVISGPARFRFLRENSKKVPVMSRINVDYANQYMPLSPVTVSPDSVVVYGQQERLDNVDRIETKTLYLSGVKDDLYGEVPLNVPVGLRVAENGVRFSQDVGRYVEVKFNCPIEVRNVPEGRTLDFHPKSVEVSVRCMFPARVRGLENIVGCYVDYDEFETSLRGWCMIRCEWKNLNGVISVESNPKTCYCIERSN